MCSRGSPAPAICTSFRFWSDAIQGPKPPAQHVCLHRKHKSYHPVRHSPTVSLACLAGTQSSGSPDRAAGHRTGTREGRTKSQPSDAFTCTAGVKGTPRRDGRKACHSFV